MLPPTLSPATTKHEVLEKCKELNLLKRKMIIVQEEGRKRNKKL